MCIVPQPSTVSMQGFIDKSEHIIGDNKSVCSGCIENVSKHSPAICDGVVIFPCRPAPFLG